MIRAKNLRTLLKETGGQNYKAKLRELLGVVTKDNPEGTFPARYDASKAQISPDEFSIRDLAEEFLGGDFVSGLHNPKTSEHYAANLKEALNPVTSSTFSDINAAFNNTIGGLIEVKILEGYTLPEFIADKLVTNVPTRVNGGKHIQIPNVQLPDGPTLEGQEYQNIGLQERWVTAQKNVKYGMKLSLTKESVIYDLSGELLNQASSLGMSLGYVKEYWQAAVVMGVNIPPAVPGFTAGRLCQTHIYKGLETDTPGATYQAAAAGKYNYVNKIAANPITSYADFQQVQSALNLMREFETGYPIMAPFSEVIVSPNDLYNVRNVIHATQVLATGGTAGLSGNQGVGTFAPNPLPTLGIHSSPLWNKVLVDSGVSQANADIYWYGGTFRKAFCWREVWPLSVVQANPLSTEMLGSDIVNAWYCSWYGVPCILDPHYVVQNTN